MNPDHLCVSICETLSGLFECTPAPRQSVRVRTPLMYPDGGIVDVFVLEDGGQRRVTDFGETLGWLRMQSVDGRRTPRQKELIEDTCQTLGVEVFRGQLVLRLHADDEIGEAVLRLAQAAVRVSDLWFTLRARPTKTTAKEVNQWLIKKEIKFKSFCTATRKLGAKLDNRLRDLYNKSDVSSRSAEPRLPRSNAAHDRTCPGRLGRSGPPQVQHIPTVVYFSLRRHKRCMAKKGLRSIGIRFQDCPLVSAS